MGMGTILFNNAEPFEQIFNTPSTSRFSLRAFLILEKKTFKCFFFFCFVFLSYMGIAAFLFSGAEPCNKLSIRQKALCFFILFFFCFFFFFFLAKIGQVVSEEKTFKDYTISYIYSRISIAGTPMAR